MNKPKTIYLNVGFDKNVLDIDDVGFNELIEVSWSEKRLSDNDIEYVLKSEVISNIEVKDFIKLKCVEFFYWWNNDRKIRKVKITAAEGYEHWLIYLKNEEYSNKLNNIEVKDLIEVKTLMSPKEFLKTSKTGLSAGFNKAEWLIIRVWMQEYADYCNKQHKTIHTSKASPTNEEMMSEINKEYKTWDKDNCCDIQSFGLGFKTGAKWNHNKQQLTLKV